MAVLIGHNRHRQHTAADTGVREGDSDTRGEVGIGREGGDFFLYWKPVPELRQKLFLP